MARERPRQPTSGLEGHRVTVTLDPRHIRQLKELAAKRKVSMAWLVRDAVERYLAPGPLFEDAVDRDRP